MMFAQIDHFEIQEEDQGYPIYSMFYDRPNPTFQTLPAENYYIQVNADEADHMLVDPAYRLEKLKEGHEKLYAMNQAYLEVVNQMSVRDNYKRTPYSKQMFESWYNIELSIRKFDRWFNRIEKFEHRAVIDTENHDRREARMLDRKKDRWANNYTYFFGGLTEEEQQYRDYFESDLEERPDNEYTEEKLDEYELAQGGQFNIDQYDFQEMSLQYESHESIQDIIEEKVFKYKYRMSSDPDYFKRQSRVMARSRSRAETRDPAISQSIADLISNDQTQNNIGQTFLNHIEGKETPDFARDATQPFRDYMLAESKLQYRDYYEDSPEEQAFFTYLDKLGNRDQIRFTEVFEDFTLNRADPKKYHSIPKREYNGELSFFNNVVLDI